jgi:hypothetical protein
MQGKARLRGRERSNYSTTISPMRNDKGFIPNETADRGLRACPNNEFGFGSCEILRVLMLVTPKRHYRDFHASFNALGTCCHSFGVAAKPTQAGFPPTSRDVRCQAGRYAVRDCLASLLFCQYCPTRRLHPTALPRCARLAAGANVPCDCSPDACSLHPGRRFSWNAVVTPC